MAGDQRRQLLVQGELHVDRPGVAEHHNEDLDPGQTAADHDLLAAPVHLSLQPGWGFKAGSRRLHLAVCLPKRSHRILDYGVAAGIALLFQFPEQGGGIEIHQWCPFQSGTA